MLSTGSYIDAWLASKFTINGKTKTPPFERTPATLRALLALAAVNEAADEEQELLAAAAANDLAQFQAQPDLPDDILDAVEAHFTSEGQTALDTLANLSQPGVLNAPSPEIERLARRMVDLQITANDIAQASDRVAVLDTHLNKELERLQVLVDELQSETYQGLAEMGKESIDYQRKAKVLAARLPELRERVASLSGGEGAKDGITVQNIKVEEERFKEIMRVVRDLETQVKGYHGLPQDTDLARLELESVRVELRDLTRQRDSMFEGLVERESPKKTRS